LEVAEEVVLLDAPPHLQRALGGERDHPRLLSEVCRNCGVSICAFAHCFLCVCTIFGTFVLGERDHPRLFCEVCRPFGVSIRTFVVVKQAN
jgi:hypothetical protein